MSYDGSVVEVTTEPPKWPGVTSLRALLDRDKDEETPNLIVLLCEAFVAIYMSLLSYALATCDAHILYRYNFFREIEIYLFFIFFRQITIQIDWSKN